MVQLLVALVALAAIVLAGRRRRGRLPARAVIVSPRKSTIVTRDGAVYSVQSAELSVARDDLERLWNATNLENLARTYWRFLSRVTLGLIRVVYTQNERRVVLIARPFTLLRFDPPEYGTHRDRGTVRWRIRDGLLVARSGRRCGYLALDVRREPGLDEQGRAKLRIEVEVANFYPSIVQSFSTPVYEATQSVIHVLVTHAFLRSLATLQLAESRIGRFSNDHGEPPSEQTPAPGQRPPAAPEQSPQAERAQAPAPEPTPQP